jgi:hypothetical protein
MKTGWGGSRPGAGAKPKYGNGKRQHQLERQICIYVIAEEGIEDVCKIGITDRIVRRLGQLQSSNWRKLTVVAAFRLYSPQDASEIESRLLTFYSKSRIRGEWIGASPQDVKEAIVRGLQSVSLPIENLIEETSREARLRLIKFDLSEKK